MRRKKRGGEREIRFGGSILRTPDSSLSPDHFGANPFPAPSESAAEGLIPPPIWTGSSRATAPIPYPSACKGKRYHWFDGRGQLHDLRLRDGKASYSDALRPHLSISGGDRAGRGAVP